MKIKDQKIDDFLSRLAGKNPTPGGGAVAALVGTMAASLVVKVCNLTKGANSLQLIADSANQNKRRLLDLADEDCRAFEAVMAVYKSKSKFKIKKALQKAIEVPQETMRLANKIEKLAKIVSEKGNQNAFSDAKSAEFLAEAAAKCALENIKINQKLLAGLG